MQEEKVTHPLFKNARERYKLLRWLKMFFETFFPYAYKVLNDPDFHKDKPIKDIGWVFIRAQGVKDTNNTCLLEMMYTLPDSPIIYELFITALAVKMRTSKKIISQSIKEFSENLHKLGPLKNISIYTYCTIMENLNDETDVYAIKQEPNRLIDLYIDLLRTKKSLLGFKEENLEQIQKNLVSKMPKFLINQVN